MTMSSASITTDERGEVLLHFGNRVMEARHVYIRATDGQVFISGATLGGLDEGQAEMVQQLERVQAVGTVKVG